jgi:hypothetical protein
VSYCRWSTDDFQCDLYVFDHCYGGTAVYVARRKRRFKAPLPPPITGKWWEDDKRSKAFWGRHNQVMEMLDDKYEGEFWDWEKLPEPHAGATYIVETHADAIELIGKLRAAGFNAPTDLEDVLRETPDCVADDESLGQGEGT